MGFISYNTVCHIFFCTLYGQFITTGSVVKIIILFFFNQLANKQYTACPLFSNRQASFKVEEN